MLATVTSPLINVSEWRGYFGIVGISVCRLNKLRGCNTLISDLRKGGAEVTMLLVFFQVKLVEQAE